MTPNYQRTWKSCYWGAAIQALAINVVPLFFAILQSQFSVSFEMLGRLVLINFLTQLTMDLLSLYIVDRLGYRICFMVAHGATAVGLVLFGILPRIMSTPYVGMVLATLVFSAGAGLLEVLISPMADALPSKNKATSLTLVHAFYPLGQVAAVVVTTLLLSLLGNDYWWAIIMAWAVLPLSNLIRGLRIPFPTVESASEHGGLLELFSCGAFWIAFGTMICAGAAEQSMAQWASLFAEKGLGIPKVMGDLLGPCLFALFMGVGRFWYGRFGDHVPLRPVLMTSSVLCVLCYALAVFSPWPLLALLGCAFCGLSVSLMWPGTLSYVVPRVSRGGTALFASLALAGDVGCSLGPWLTGFVSDAVQPYYTGGDPEQFGLRMGLMTAILFPVVMFVLLAVFSRNEKNKIKD